MTGQEDRASAMDSIYEDYAAVPVLAELAAGRKPVRGCGPLDSPLLVIGEAPGEEEERRDMPFVGRSGKLLQELFAKADIPWRLCYVTNAVCWRPPGNRTPYPFQVQASAARIEREIALVDPIAVVAAGSTAWRGVTQGLLGPFEQARFKSHDLGGRALTAIPHPAYLLRLKHDRADWELMTVEALGRVLTGAGAE